MPFLKKITDWANWPFLLFYAPVALAWPWYYLRSRSLWFFTAANPTITFGGFEGEAKSEMYAQLPAHLLPRSAFINPSNSFAQVLQHVHDLKLTYPFIVKPDVGMKGLLFRKIEHAGQLETYHRHMPAAYIVQEFCTMPLEVSVFYYRKPGETTGRITALIEKKLPYVTGNGQQTVLELVQSHADAKNLLPLLEKNKTLPLTHILQHGETFRVSHIANLFNGAEFKNRSAEIDAGLLRVFDAISHTNQFYYGRYDIKCNTIGDLKKGTNFFILEFNGAGSTPNHIFTGTYTLLQAYNELLLHWRLLYEASAANTKLGYPYWSFLKGHRFLKASKKHFAALKQLDATLQL